MHIPTPAHVKLTHPLIPAAFRSRSGVISPSTTCDPNHSRCCCQVPSNRSRTRENMRPRPPLPSSPHRYRETPGSAPVRMTMKGKCFESTQNVDAVRTTQPTSLRHHFQNCCWEWRGWRGKRVHYGDRRAVRGPISGNVSFTIMIFENKHPLKFSITHFSRAFLTSLYSAKSFPLPLHIPCLDRVSSYPELKDT